MENSKMIKEEILNARLRKLIDQRSKKEKSSKGWLKTFIFYTVLFLLIYILSICLEGLRDISGMFVAPVLISGMFYMSDRVNAITLTIEQIEKEIFEIGSSLYLENKLDEDVKEGYFNTFTIKTTKKISKHS